MIGALSSGCGAIGGIGPGGDAGEVAPSCRSRDTPGIARAAEASMRADAAVGDAALRTNAACSMPGNCDVVDVAALAGQQARILDARDGGSEITCAHGGSPCSRGAASQRRLDDALVAGAAADVAGHRTSRIRSRRRPAPRAEAPASVIEHARRAEAALQA